MPGGVGRVLLETQAVIRAATVPSFVWDPKQVLSFYRVPQLPSPRPDAPSPSQSGPLPLKASGSSLLSKILSNASK